MHTLSFAEVHRTAADGDVEEGALRCENPACARRYPIVDGVALVIPDLSGWQRGELAGVVEGPLHPATEALLAQGGPDDEPWPRLIEHLSIYLDAHWGDRAEPPPDGPTEVAFGLRALAERVAARASQPVASAVELGCSVGRVLALLANGAERVVGVDLHFGALRRARRLLRGEALPYARRTSGRHYATAVARADELTAPAAVFVCADALDPPLAPAHFNRVAALNLVDALRAPAQLLSVVDGLCAPGGEVLLASPYGWRSGIVDERRCDFCEAKRLKKDALSLSQRKWIEAAICEGVPLNSILIVEWTSSV